MNLGRALLQGAASGLKSAADQVAADRELDNRLRLMAVDDMFKQRIAEQGRNWNIEDRNQDRTWKNEDQQHAEDLATDTEYAGKLGQAAIAQAKPKLQFERDQKITDANNPDLLAANRALADSNQSTSDVNLKNKQADNYDAMANLRRAGVEFDADGNPVRSSGGSKGKTKSLLDQTLDIKESNIKEIASLQGLITNSIPRNSEEANYIQKRIDSLNKQNEAIGNSLLNFNAQSSEAPADLGNYTKFGLTKAEANKAVTRDYSQYQIDSIAKEKGVDPSLMKGMLNSESSISNPNAVSSAGAKGPFQFLDGTFKQYADKDMNDVNNPVHAARANANYINKLSEDFNDNPALVAAGYNAGEGRVKDAIKTLKSHGKEISTENIMSLMPSETQNYVPKVLAYKDFLDDKSQSKVADSGQIQSDAKPDDIQEKAIIPKTKEPVYLDRNQKEEFKKTQYDLVKDLFEPKASGDTYDNQHERLALFKNYVDSTGDIQGAKTLALASTFTNGVPTYNGKLIPKPQTDSDNVSSKSNPQSDSAPNNSSQLSQSGFDSKDIARINKFPDIVQQAIIKSDNPQKVLETFEKNNFDIGSIRKELISSLTDAQQRLFNRMTPEQQREFLTNPEATFNDYKPSAPFYDGRNGLLGLSKK